MEKTDWGALYEELEERDKANPKEEIRANPYDDSDKRLLTKAEKTYYRARMKAWDLLEKRRTVVGFKNVVYRQFRQSEEDLELKEFGRRAPYIFLQYMWLIKEWATQRYDVTEKEFYALLYLYPVGIFDQVEADLVLKAMGVDKSPPKINLRKLKSKKLVTIWERGRTEDGIKYPTMYCLNTVAKDMCSKAHSIALGKNKMPYTAMRNPLLKGKNKTFFKDMIERINERVDK